MKFKSKCVQVHYTPGSYFIQKNDQDRHTSVIRPPYVWYKMVYILDQGLTKIVTLK